MATVDCDRDYTNPFDERDELREDVYDTLLDATPDSNADVTSVAVSRDQGVLLHRIAEVRQRQGVTLRNVARRLGMSLPVVRRQEQGDCDLRLSDLHRWQQVLEVPVAELLVEGEGSLSGPVLQRSRMVKLMKTAAAIRERSRDAESVRLVSMLVEQILEIMPELADVTPWHSVGQRRTREELGRTARMVVSEEMFRRPSGLS